MANSDETLEERLRVELVNDPRLPYAHAIAIQAYEGGGVAFEHATNLYGVTGVSNEIKFSERL